MAATVNCAVYLQFSAVEELLVEAGEDPLTVLYLVVLVYPSQAPITHCDVELFTN